jgi:hypothetical protein
VLFAISFAVGPSFADPSSNPNIVEETIILKTPPRQFLDYCVTPSSEGCMCKHFPQRLCNGAHECKDWNRIDTIYVNPKDPFTDYRKYPKWASIVDYKDKQCLLPPDVKTIRRLRTPPR